jgi:membrane fusion protein, multidrug efflux system
MSVLPLRFCRRRTEPDAGPGRVAAGGRLALAVLLLAGLCGCHRDAATDLSKLPVVTVARPLSATVPRYLDATGQAQSIASVTLLARVEGTLKSIGYQDGALVRKGQRLFLIEPDLYAAKLASAQASVVQARATLTNDAIQYTRQIKLRAQDATSAQSVDTAKANRDTAAGQLAAAQADVKQARINLDYTSVAAPFDGIATAHLADPGAMVGYGGTPTQLATVVVIDQIRVVFTVGEADARSIQSLAKAPASFGAIEVLAGTAAEAGYPHRGRMDYVAPQIDSASGTLALRALFANSDRALLPGAFVRLRVVIGVWPHALLVPATAVGTDQQGRYVFCVGKDGAVMQRPVVTASGPGGLQIVSSGLAAQDAVVIDGIAALAPGMKVRSRWSAIRPGSQPAVPASDSP